MSTATLPTPATRTGVPASAVLDEVRDHCSVWPEFSVVRSRLPGPDDAGGHPVVVRDQRSRVRAGPVIVAPDDDDNAGPLLCHGLTLATRLGVPLRAVYVWSDCRPPDCVHHRCCHRDLA